MQIFLDSGAFTAFTQGKPINLKEYIAFIHRYKSDIDVYANLDVIQNSKYSWRNQRIMEKNGLSPLPVYHLEDPISDLYKCMEYDYFCIGGMARGFSTAAKSKFLDKCFNILEKEKCLSKVHGFGLTAIDLTLRYTWYSVDSSSWVLRGSAYGLLDIPTNPAMKTKDDCHITNIAIGTGIKGFGDDYDVPSMFPDVTKISQLDARLTPGSMRRNIIESLLSDYGFSLEALQTDSYGRACWNAIYQILAIRRFSKINVFLAAGDSRIVEMLVEKTKDTKLDKDDLNFLISYASIPKNPKSETHFEKLIKLKKQIG